LPCIQLWSFNGKELHSNFSVQLDFTVPKTVAFADNAEGDIHVFGIYSGYWHVLRGSDGHIKASKDDRY